MEYKLPSPEVVKCGHAGTLTFCSTCQTVECKKCGQKWFSQEFHQKQNEFDELLKRFIYG